MYYINCYSFLNNPDKDWEKLIEQSKEPPIQLSLFDCKHPTKCIL